MYYQIERIHLIREVDGKQTNNWNFSVKHVANNLDDYRKEIREKYKATRVLLTHTLIENEGKTKSFQSQQQRGD
jgi:hypothetical protein